MIIDNTFRIMKNNKWISVLVICAIGIMCFNYNRGQSRHKINYDVLLNSYMRGGSTLSGIVIGSRNDTFYLYEPLWKNAQWVYWKGHSTLCRSDRYECRHLEPGDTTDMTFYHNEHKAKGIPLETAKNILHSFYDCQLGDLERNCITNLQVQKGGPNWQRIRDCRRHGSSLKICLHEHGQTLCRNSTNRVSKVLRLSTDNLGSILEERKILKVFHLFRDRRAIINSRITTDWYPDMSHEAILNNSIGLCDKMLYDFREGKKLLQKYPDRFKFLFYEDMNEDPLEKVRAMYRFVGMSPDENLYSEGRSLPVLTPKEQQSQRIKDTAFWWRTSLDWKIVQAMDDICADIYKELGYVSIKNIDDFRDLSISSVNLSKEYSLNVV